MNESFGEKIDIDGTQIYYEILGNGEHKVLLLPGLLGSIEFDFCDQMKGFDKNQFTLIGWDPPGYGKSRPNNRIFINWYQNDADLLLKLMEKLKIERFSLIGFSDGARTAILIAAQHPEMIEKLVLCGASTYYTPAQTKTISKFRDVSIWSEDKLKKYKDVYGDDLQEIWKNYFDSFKKISDVIIKREVLEKIQCPTFVVHGGRDIMAPHEPHAHYLKFNIKNSRLHIFPRASHECHKENSAQFNAIVQQFLLRK